MIRLRMHGRRVTILWMAGYLMLNTANAVLVRESGADASRWLWYFTLANIAGPLSLVCLMRTYARMHINVASGVAMGGGAACVQLAFLILYRALLSGWQWFGVLLIVTGAVLAVTAQRPSDEAVDHV